MAASAFEQRAAVQSLASKPSTAWSTNYRRGIDKSSGCSWSIWPSECSYFLGHSSPNLRPLSLSSLAPLFLSVSSFSLHMLFLSLSLTPTLFTPPSLLSLHLLSVYWVTAGKENQCHEQLNFPFLPFLVILKWLKVAEGGLCTLFGVPLCSPPVPGN